ncbi:MAG: hypothetical protein WBI14_08625 [Anaerolineaceae bacterium]
MNIRRKLLIILSLLNCVYGCNRKVYDAPVPIHSLPTPIVSIQHSLDSHVTTVNEISSSGAGLFEENPPYAVSNPATTLDEIRPMLRVIQKRYLAGITNQGWYASKVVNGSAQVWIYIDDPLTYRIREVFDTAFVSNFNHPSGNNVILGMMLADGKNGTFTLNTERNETIPEEIDTYPGNRGYFLNEDLPEYFFQIQSHFLNVIIFHNYINESEEMNQYQMQISYKAWLSGSADNRVLEVETNMIGLAGKKNTESDVRQTEAATSERFNWNSGQLISWQTVQKFTDGSTLTTSQEGRDLDIYAYQYYERLPIDVQLLYDNAARKLKEAYLARGIN